MRLCRSTVQPSVLLIAVLTTACTDSKPGQSDAVVPRWQGRADLTIGSLDGEHDQFGDVSGIVADQQGRIFVADADNHTIVAFDSAGRYLYNIGRAGRGPGELQAPCCLTVDSRGQLWVRDGSNARYNVYAIGESSATLAESRTMSAGTGGLWSKITFDPAGRLVDVVTRPFEDRMLMLRVHVDSAGTAARVDTILAPPNDSLGVFPITVNGDIGVFTSQPYGPRLLVAQAPGGGWARAVSSRYLVNWMVNGDSARARTIRRDLIGPALSARERQEADSSLQYQAGQVGRAVNSLPFSVPGSKTPIHAVMFDQQGRLWVQLNVGDGEANRADVWDSTGSRVGNAEWPSGIDLRQGSIDDRSAYGVRQDSTGVPQVVRVRFRSPG